MSQDDSSKIHAGKTILQDPKAESSDPSKPAFLARPEEAQSITDFLSSKRLELMVGVSGRSLHLRTLTGATTVTVSS
jgi:hypothetical protein